MIEPNFLFVAPRRPVVALALALSFTFACGAADERPLSTQKAQGIAEQALESEGEQASNDDGSPNTGNTPVDPEDDEDIQFMKDNGYETQYFAQTCRSVAEDGSTIEESEQADLPVGEGRVLECETDSFPVQSTIEFLSSALERWCALGSVSSYEGGGDDRLQVDVASVPGDGPGTLIGSRDGDPITIHRVSGFGGGTLWPLWITTTYSVTEVKRSEPGKLCDEVFGL